MGSKKTAFFTYPRSASARRAAVALAERLSKDGIDVWFDQWDIKPGEPWEASIQEALNQASSVVAIVDKKPREQTLFERELKFAVDQNKSVIPVLTDDATFEDIPELIRDRQAVAPTGDIHAYHQLLVALGKDTSDELDSLPFLKRLRRYLAND